MDRFHVDLDSATGRRADIEANFRTHARPGWTPTRFPAVDTAYVSGRGIGGAASDGEKARLFGHGELLGAHVGRADPLYILQGDASCGV
jgi:hypothetical protein